MAASFSTFEGSVIMLKACPYCGRVHDSRFHCGEKPVRIKKRTGNSGFRSTNAWTKKSLEIRERDCFLCQCCLRNYEGTVRELNYADIEVHHIEPLETSWELRLDNGNLISLCRLHHEMAEEGRIQRQQLHEMARGNERESG